MCTLKLEDNQESHTIDAENPSTKQEGDVNIGTVKTIRRTSVFSRWHKDVQNASRSILQKMISKREML